MTKDYKEIEVEWFTFRHNGENYLIPNVLIFVDKNNPVTRESFRIDSCDYYISSTELDRIISIMESLH